MSPAIDEQLDGLEADLSGGRFAAVREAVEPLIDACGGEQRLRAEVLLRMADNRLGRYEPDRARELVETLRAAGSPLLCQGALALGQALLGAQRVEEAERAFGDAVQGGRDVGDLATASRALALLGAIRAQRQDVEGAVALLREGIAGLEAVGDLREAGLRWMGLANLLLWQGRREDAAAAYDAAERCAAPFPQLLADVLRSRTRLTRQLADLEATRRLLDRALAVVAPGSMVSARILNDLGDLARTEGRFDDARRHLHASLDARAGREETITRLNLALLELDAGDRAAARAALQPLLEHEQQVWYRAFAHGVGVAAADDPEDLDVHLQALEAAAAASTYADADLLDLLGRATKEWAARDVHQAARLAALHHAQATALDLEVEAAEEASRALRDRGASVPLGPLAARDVVRSGGMGEVWRGDVRGTSLAVAIKVLAGARAHDPRVRDALARELRLVARLDHPHIVPLVDHGTITSAIDAMTGGRLTRGLPWLATRWASCGTLADWCGRVPFSRIRAALLQLLDALSAAHVDGLLHLDVKPANVLVAQDEPLVTWLADFGIARALSADTDATVAGTPAFMAPEQCRGRVAHYGPWTDLYAVGGTAVALVQGHPPFSGSSSELLQQQVSRPAPPLCPSVPVPDGFAAWCAQLLAKAPEQRFRCAADAASALAALPDAPDAHAPSAPAGLPASFGSSSSTFALDALPEAPEPAPAPAAPRHVAGIPPSPPVDPVAPPVPELAAAASRLLPLRRVPLVGRDQEREVLWSALRAASSGLRVVQLRAQAGAGRTHLLRWLADAAGRTGGARVLWVGDTDGDPWRKALQRLLQVQGWGLEAVERGLPRLLDLHVGAHRLGETERGLLAQILADDGGGAPLDPVPMTLRIVEEMSRERPVLVCLATPDPGGVALLERLTSTMADRRVLVVCSEDLPCPPAVEAFVQTVALGPLDARAAAALVDALLPLDPELRAALIEASAGDPAAIVWTVRRWLVDRALKQTRAGLSADRGRPLPGTADEAVRRVLDPVVAASAAHRRRLQLAAVLGERFDREVWARLCEVDGVGFDPTLPDALVGRGLLREDGDALRFTDRVVLRVVRGDTTEAERAERHRAAALAVPDDARKGAHSLAAGLPADALPPLRRVVLRSWRGASRIARQRLALWRQARERSELPDTDPEVIRGVVTGWLAEPPHHDLLPEIDLRIAQARALGDPDVLALGWLARAGVHRHRAGREGLRVAAAEAAVAADPQDDEVRRVALHQLGRARLDAGDREGALGPLRAAVDLGDGFARVWYAAALHGAGEIAEAARWVEVARPALERSAYAEIVPRLALAATLAQATGHPDIAEQRLREAVALGDAVSSAAAGLARANVLMFAARSGDHARTRAALADLGVLAGSAFREVVRALFEAGDATPQRLEQARSAALGTSWGVDGDEVAELITLAADWPEWREHRDGLLELADAVRHRDLARGAEPGG